MKTMRAMFFAGVVLATMLLFVWPAAESRAAAKKDTGSVLRQRRRELEMQLLRERARILREDPEAIALQEKIQRLYQHLDQLLAQKPAVRQLQADINQLDKTLKTAAPKSGKKESTP